MKMAMNTPTLTITLWLMVQKPVILCTLVSCRNHFMVRTVWHTAMGELSVALTVTMIPGVVVTVPLYTVAVEALGVAGGLESAPIVC